jgi:uncharacterized protein (TIGR03435 family)
MKTFLLVLLTACAAYTQGADVRPRFEVASVKRSNECLGGHNAIDPGSVTLSGVPLKIVMMEAFKVKVEQIEGPSWLETECIDVSAKIPQGAPSDQVPSMLQALLAERFRMAEHKEDRTRSGYALVVDKGGPKFKEDDPKEGFMRTADGRQLAYIPRAGSGRGGLKGVITMAQLASSLSREWYGPVEDATGLTGKYDIDVSWVRDTASAPNDPVAPGAEAPAPEGPNLFAALRESLGLRLERRNVQVPFVVIDHIERVPTEN